MIACLPRHTLSVTLSPTWERRTARIRSFMVRTVVPLSAVTMSPFLMPALAAPVSGMTLATSAPSAMGRPAADASVLVTVAPSTPRNGCVALVPEMSSSAMRVAVWTGMAKPTPALLPESV